MHPHHTARRIVPRGIAVLKICLAVASCGDDDDDSATGSTAPVDAPASSTVVSITTSATPATSGTSRAAGDACAAKDALGESITDLQDMDLSGGAAGIQDALGDVKDDLAELRSSVSDELQPDVQAVEQAVQDLETALGDIGSGGLGEAVSAVSELASAGGSLIHTLEEGCGSSSTTSSP